MAAQITPTRVLWVGPSGTGVQLDEDGVTLRWPSRPSAIEEGEVDQLLEVIAEAKRCKAFGNVPAPHVPPRDSWQRESRAYQARRLVDVAAKAIRRELRGDDEVPF